MAQVLIFRRLGNLLIVEGKYCLDTNDVVLSLEIAIKNDIPQNEIGGRICDLSMGGIGNITPKVWALYNDEIDLDKKNESKKLVRSPYLHRQKIFPKLSLAII